jgi:hypothetical protein
MRHGVNSWIPVPFWAAARFEGQRRHEEHKKDTKKKAKNPLWLFLNVCLRGKVPDRFTTVTVKYIGGKCVLDLMD